MASNISPGVYTKIIDLSTYVQAVPSTIGFICSLTKKGEDNKLKFFGSRADYVAECGEPNITDFGKQIGQGPYCAYNFLGESGSLFHIRCMPETASFANTVISANFPAANEEPEIVLSYIPVANASNLAELRTALASTGDIHPLCVLRPIGRGEYYNNLSIRITSVANPLANGIYVLDIYETQADGSEVIVESFEFSFNESAVDGSSESAFLPAVLELYSKILRAEMYEVDDTLTEGYDILAKVFDKNVGVVSLSDVTGAIDGKADGTAMITDTKQDFSDWETLGGVDGQYIIIVKDGRGNELYGWLGAASGTDNESVEIFDSRLAAGSYLNNWLPADAPPLPSLEDPDEHAIALAAFDENSEITYEIMRSYTPVSLAFASSDPVPLKKGTDGDMRDSTGTVIVSEGAELLAAGYAGQLVSNVDGATLVDEILDTENIYFNLVFDCGYPADAPADVKASVAVLAETRKDCMAIMDNGDNKDFNAAILARNTDNPFNTYLAALYECYNKVYDTFTGTDIWFSPIFHMSYLLPRNDNVAEIWFAAAGFNRASISTIKELRYNPRLGQRDQMYLKQLNPIVKFNPGYTVWGQLTTQARASALQDINIVRLVLYCKRALEEYCRYFIFEQNDEITWSAVSHDIVEFLESIKAKRGLYSYSLEVSATEYEKKTKTFHVNVTLEPTRVVEKIELNFFIK